MNEQDNISSLGNKPHRLSDEMLAAYLAGQLSPEQQHEVERWLDEEGMESDAIEGLQQMRGDETKLAVSRLNQKLKTQLAGKKRTTKKFYADSQWTFVAIFVVLLLCLLAFVVLQLVKN
jgi:anti-sigma factor RsiW